MLSNLELVQILITTILDCEFIINFVPRCARVDLLLFTKLLFVGFWFVQRHFVYQYCLIPIRSYIPFCFFIWWPSDCLVDKCIDVKTNKFTSFEGTLWLFNRLRDLQIIQFIDVKQGIWPNIFFLGWPLSLFTFCTERISLNRFCLYRSPCILLITCL